jgi:AbrB family looped-hinge helix DNA binding protein
MTYTATISSKGQITIPIEARRKLGLGKKVSINLEADRLVITQPPSMEDAWAILDAPAKNQKLSEREALLSEAFSKKDRQKRGY